jgi:hypothetical protein
MSRSSEENENLVRLIMIFATITFSASSAAAALPLGGLRLSTSEKALQVHLTKSNACKLKYKHKKAAQDLREKAHCK